MSGNWHQAAEFMSTIRKGTSLFPFLATDVISGLLLIELPFVNILVQVVLLLIFVATMAATLYCSLYFMKNDPDRLGSEEHMERKRAMDVLVGDEKYNLGTRAEHVVAVLNNRITASKADFIELPPNSEIQVGPSGTDSLQLE